MATPPTATTQGDEYMFSLEGFLSKNICSTDEIAALWNEGDATYRPPRSGPPSTRRFRSRSGTCTPCSPLTSPNLRGGHRQAPEGRGRPIDMVPLFEDYLNLYMTN